MNRLLIVYSHFAPAFKAGGPVQSLVNLVEVLRIQFRVYIICSAHETGEKALLPDVVPDKWSAFSEGVSVYYLDRNQFRSFKAAFVSCNPDLVYINGVFLPLYNWYPVWLSFQNRKKVVIAPRGMFQQGAMEIRALKKRIFVFGIRMLGIGRRVRWHATDSQEKLDIQRIFGLSVDIRVAANVPTSPLPDVVHRAKNVGDLKLVYLSLISEKKNLLMVLEALRRVRTPIEFDIYGPIVDERYWSQCLEAMSGQIHNIQYKGFVRPEIVKSILSRYHAFVLPTRGENFGHAIYEAFSVGTPAILSAFTPWGILQEKEAGITIDMNVDSLKRALERFVSYDDRDFFRLSKGAHQTAIDYFRGNDFKKMYEDLFGQGGD